jgi:hypothetical protein
MSDSLDNSNGFGGGADYGSFGGSVEAIGGIGGMGGIGGGNSIGAMGGNGDGTGSGGGIGAAGSGDFGLSGPGAFEATTADYTALGALAGLGFFAGSGMTGWSAATAVIAQQIAAAYGTSVNVALAHVAHDIGISMAWGGQTALSSGQ